MIAKWGDTPGGPVPVMFRVHFGVQSPEDDPELHADSFVSRCKEKRRGRDSNPDAREGAGFRDLLGRSVMVPGGPCTSDSRPIA